ncbi:MAG: helix-turn-helix transcriptional regulator [Marinilabiliaceae bacterium]|nr:helix-turn-helix transcriptional regulator [Marinilabiliaceae bacterium]
MYHQPQIRQIQRLLGPATEEQLRFIDTFLFEDIAIFLPVAGPCYYALSEDHVHPSYMVIYSFTKKGKGWVKGIAQDALNPGDFLIMPPNIKHQEIEESETPRYLAVCIMPELIEPIAHEYEINMDQLRSDIITTKANSQFLPLCWQFIAESGSWNQCNKSLLKAISIQICHSIIRSLFQPSKQSNQTQWRPEIGQSVAFIHSHLHEKIGLRDIANAAHMSISNFSRCFKKEMEQTPIEYLLEQRLYKAKSMLLSDQFAMTDIATSCGFNTVSYFSSSFRKQNSISPEKYRQRLKK